MTTEIKDLDTVFEELRVGKTYMADCVRDCGIDNEELLNANAAVSVLMELARATVDEVMGVSPATHPERMSATIELVKVHIDMLRLMREKSAIVDE